MTDRALSLDACLAELPSDHAEWLAAEIERRAPGWRRAQRQQVRNAALRDLGAIVGRGKITATARKIEILLKRYLSSAWLTDRYLSNPAVAEANRMLLFRIAKANGGDDLSDRQIIRILSVT